MIGPQLQQWDTATPMLQDLCDGHPDRVLELRGFVTPWATYWFCHSCWPGYESQRRQMSYWAKRGAG